MIAGNVIVTESQYKNIDLMKQVYKVESNTVKVKSALHILDISKNIKIMCKTSISLVQDVQKLIYLQLNSGSDTFKKTIILKLENIPKIRYP